MKGINVSQARAEELSAHFETYHDPNTGFWIRTDNVSRTDFTYAIYKTGDVEQEIPSDAIYQDWRLDIPGREHLAPGHDALPGQPY